MLRQDFSWQGRVDSEDGEKGMRWHQMVNQPHTEQPGIALLGLACDLGVANNKGRVGAKTGPNAIRSALANLAWHQKTGLLDAGDQVELADLASTQQAYAEHLTSLLGQHSLVIGLGGGHEIAWGSYLGIHQALEATKRSKKRIGIVNFDAHFDLRKPAPLSSSGTPFRQIAEHCQQRGLPFDYACLGVAETANTPALFDYADQLGCRYLLDRQCQTERAQMLLEPMLRQIDHLYISICLDALPASVAPGVSAPSALGIQLDFVIDMLHFLAQSQQEYAYHWQYADLAEMNPQYDIDNRTAKVAARLVFELVKAKFAAG